nr:MAG TPA: DASH complex subunit Dad3 [Caudoviricetes sp.]
MGVAPIYTFFKGSIFSTTLGLHIKGGNQIIIKLAMCVLP